MDDQPQGLTLQIYVAMIASLLISLWAGKRATKRTYEMFCLYFVGWASEAELRAISTRSSAHPTKRTARRHQIPHNTNRADHY